MKAIKHRLFTLVNSVTSFISANGGGELNKVAICKIQFKKVSLYKPSKINYEEMMGKKIH